MINSYDIGIIGVGVAGAFASYKLAKEHKDLKCVAFDIGRKWAKRRRQLEGFLGCLPNSDGKFYLNDLSNLSSLLSNESIEKSNNEVMSILSNIKNIDIIKSKSPKKSLINKFKKLGYATTINDYFQLIPQDIHSLSRHLAATLEDSNIDFNFEEEILNIRKQNSMFVISTEEQEFSCKRLILASGRCGWRWAKKMFSELGIIENDDIAKFGIRVEMNSEVLSDFRKSCCTFTSKDVTVGPLCWDGTVIPEDHVDMAISAFRSNENRWLTNKVSFTIIGNRPFTNNGIDQMDRLSRLTFLISNDRISKERVSLILKDRGLISVMPEYKWLKESLISLSDVIPNITTKAYYHVPTITTTVPKINISSDLSTDIDGLYVIGENAGVNGLLAAACMGIKCIDSIIK